MLVLRVVAMMMVVVMVMVVVDLIDRIYDNIW